MMYSYLTSEACFRDGARRRQKAATAHVIARWGLMSVSQLKWETGEMTVAWKNPFTS